MPTILPRGACAALLAALLAGCATMSVPPLTVDEALAMSKAGASPDAIIAKMRDTRARYDLTASDMVRLHEQGMPPPVLDYMQRTQLEQVRSEERQNRFIFSFGWSHGMVRCRPHWRHCW
ncbi:hypothetical protein [Chitinimonas lacunae]|uniref:Lipoprotein n=1 Tax=Chitinimonas lacunae TaxID=1963018 RepID=A0ABV8MMH7_9NEIS